MIYTLEMLEIDPAVQQVDVDKWFVVYYDEKDTPAGIFFIHASPLTGNLCQIPIPMKVTDGTPFYEGEQWHHMPSDNGGLSLMPSIACRACGTHGYIWEGCWQTAPPPMVYDKPEENPMVKWLRQFIGAVIG